MAPWVLGSSVDVSLDRGHVTRAFSDGRSQMEPKEPRTPVGLALSGGGGKGAYEIGCWSALRDLDIPVRAVAGTSVGALNAALVAQGDLEKAQELWAHIGARDVFALTLPRLPVLALRLLLIAGLPYYRSYSSGKRRLDSRVIAASVLAFLTSVPFIVVLIATGYMHMSWADAADTMIFDGSLMLIVGVPIAGWFWMERRNLFVLDNQPLMATISRSLDTEKVRRSEIEAFVTAARPIDYFDPDDPALYPNPADPSDDWPYLARAYLPIYSRLNGQSGSQIVQLLLSSTSLPFGIFPNRRESEVGWLDGGVADNTPIIPLRELGCDPIVVVHLDHKLAKWWRRGKLDKIVGARVAVRERMRKNWQSSEANLRRFENRRRRMRRSGKSPDLGEGIAPPTVPMPRLVHIVPSRRLGGLLRGTLRFSPRRAEWLMRLGYCDASEALLKYLVPEPPKSPSRLDRVLRVLRRVAAVAGLAVLILSGLALAVYLISRFGLPEHREIPVLESIGTLMIVLPSGMILLGFLVDRRSPDPDSLTGCFFWGAAGLSFILGLIVFFNGKDGITSTQIVIDVVTDVLLLAAIGAGLRSLLRSWKTGHPKNSTEDDAG